MGYDNANDVILDENVYPEEQNPATVSNSRLSVNDGPHFGNSNRVTPEPLNKEQTNNSNHGNASGNKTPADNFLATAAAPVPDAENGKEEESGGKKKKEKERQAKGSRRKSRNRRRTRSISREKREKEEKEKEEQPGKRRGDK